MPPEFPRPRKDQSAPTGGLPDELLVDVPEGGPPTSLRAYGHGRGVRRLVYLLLAVGTIIAFFAGRWYIEELRGQRETVSPSYETIEGVERPKVFHWSEGRARLGLHRGDAGIEAIVLPDRVLHLPDGVDDAQVVVVVEDGRTTAVRVVSGRIIERKLPAPTPRDPTATEQ